MNKHIKPFEVVYRIEKRVGYKVDAKSKSEAARAEHPAKAVWQDVIKEEIEEINPLSPDFPTEKNNDSTMIVTLTARMTVSGDKIDLPEPGDDAMTQVEAVMREFLIKYDWRLRDINWGDEVCYDFLFSFEIVAQKTVAIPMTADAIRKLIAQIKQNYKTLTQNAPYPIAHIAIYPEINKKKIEHGKEQNKSGSK